MSKEKQNVTIDVNPTQALKNLLCVFDEAQNLNSEIVELLRDGIPINIKGDV